MKPVKLKGTENTWPFSSDGTTQSTTLCCRWRVDGCVYKLHKNIFIFETYWSWKLIRLKIQGSQNNPPHILMRKQVNLVSDLQFLLVAARFQAIVNIACE